MTKEDSGPLRVRNEGEDNKLYFTQKLGTEGLVISHPKFPWECPNGHTWVGHEDGFYISLHGPTFDPELRGSPNCPYCIIEWLGEKFPATRVGEYLGKEEENGGQGPETEGE